MPIMSLDRMLPSWIHLSYKLGLSGFSLTMLIIHCITRLSNSKSLLVLIGLVFATGNAGKLSLLATGNPLIAPLTSLENSLVLDSSGSDGVLDESEINVRLLSSVGLAVGTKLLVSLGGDTLSLVSPPMLSFLAALDNSDTFGSVAGVVLTLLTGRLTIGTIVSGILNLLLCIPLMCSLF